MSQPVKDRGSKSRGLEDLDSFERYSVASERAADQIIRCYSTSFGAATRLLGSRHRRHVRNIYAVVRVADELVDGVAAEANLPMADQFQKLDELEAETESAMRTGYSSNPIVHAFARTARASGITSSLTAPFFSSMRMDLETTPTSAEAASRETTALHSFDEAAHADYVYGSAEVVGLMCLRVFMRDEYRSAAELMTLEHGARQLGAAFQNVNFLRDLADDTERLARSYLSEEPVVTPELKARWIGIIREQLADARSVLHLLPRDARVAVDCAARLFGRLTDKLDETPAEMLVERRIRVPNPVKGLLIVQSIFTASKKEVA